MEPNTLKHTEGPKHWPILLFTLFTALSVVATMYLIAVKPDFYL